MKYIAYIIVLIMVIAALAGGVIILVKQLSPEPAQTGPVKKLYTCPMVQDNYFSDKPGKCPKCGMDLIKFEDDSKPSSIPDQATIKLTPEKQQLIGIKKEKVSPRPFAKTVRAVGIISYNERKIHDVNTKFAGWVETADCCALSGKFIKTGTHLFSIYSPELVAAQQEYLTALEAVKKAGESKSDEMLRTAEQLTKAAEQKLLFWDISKEQIEQIVKDGKPSKTMWVTAKTEGFIIGDELTNGKYVNPGELVFRIVDLSTVWIETEIYEYELPFVGVGDSAAVEVSAYPGEKFEGNIKYIYPSVNTVTRTIKARIELENPDFKLKTGMYANVMLEKKLGEKTAVPVEAVMDTGKRQIVFVDMEDGFFEPREVKLGIKTEAYYEVLGGLSEGETIVTSGNFFVDSESKRKSAFQTMSPGHQHGDAGEK